MMTTPTAAAENPGVETCARCGARFGCGMRAGAARCWCNDLPVLDPLPAQFAGKGCLCPECLKTLLESAQPR